MAHKQQKESKPRLEHRSSQFAKKLFHRHPEWKQYQGHHERIEGELPVYYLFVHVPSANPNVADPLKITTYPHEIIVSWLDGWHRHFDQWPRSYDDLDYIDRALDFIDWFVSDAQIIGSYYRDGKPTMGGFDVTSDSESLSRWLDPKHGPVITRSWHGVHDRKANWNVTS